MKKETDKPEEIKRILKKVTEENDLSKQEIEALENLKDVNGGMKKALIGIGIALSGTVLGAAALYGGKRFNQWHKERNEKPADTASNLALIRVPKRINIDEVD